MDKVMLVLQYNTITPSDVTAPPGVSVVPRRGVNLVPCWDWGQENLEGHGL